MSLAWYHRVALGGLGSAVFAFLLSVSVAFLCVVGELGQLLVDEFGEARVFCCQLVCSASWRSAIHTNNATGLENLDPVAAPVQDATHFRNIRAARANLKQAEADLRTAVQQAREAGDSWTVIGAALEITRQAAYQRFGRN